MDKYRKYWNEKMTDLIAKFERSSRVEIAITDITKVSNRKYGTNFIIANQKTYTSKTEISSIHAPKTYGMDFFEELEKTAYYQKHLRVKKIRVEITNRKKGQSIPIRLKLEVLNN